MRPVFSTNWADRLLSRAEHYPAAPLTDEQLDSIILGRAADAAGLAGPLAACRRSGGRRPNLPGRCRDLRFCNFEQAPNEPFFYRKKPIRQPIWGCAFQAATLTALHLRDAVVVAHAPRSCAHMCRVAMCSFSGKSLKRQRQYHADPMSPNLVCTDMKVPDMIYGGTELLIQTLKQVLAAKPPVVFLTTSCPPAIIGDDIVEARSARAQPVSPATVDSFPCARTAT